MTATPHIGMNLTGVTYYGSQFPFIDRMKTVGEWDLLGGDKSTIKLNKDGYPTEVPAGFNDVYAVVGVDPVSAGTNDTYVLTYTGKATIELLGTKILSNEPGKIVFQFTNTDGPMMPIKVKDLDPSSPLSEMHIVRSDQVDLFAKGQIFNPAFLSKVSAYDTLRYMDWSGTNDSNVVNWADRTKISNITWQDSGSNSVPLEVMVALANQTKTNMWLNVPTKASDDYVRQMMTYVRDNLDPTLSVKLEYSNEVWNWSFQQSQYAHREAAKLWGKDSNGDGVINPEDPAEQYGAGWVTYYGYRAAQVANIANQVFSNDDRLHNVLMSQMDYLGIENSVLDGVARAGLGAVGSLFDDYSVSTYFGNLSGATEADRATILSWARSGDVGLTAAFAALKDGTGIAASGSLASAIPIFAYQAGVAKKQGLDLVAYEGGISLTALNFSGADQREVMAFFGRLNADPRMGDLYRQMISDFATAGGKELTAFNDTGADSVWGTWGSLKSIYDKGSPKWDALVDAERMADAADAVASGQPGGTQLPAGLTDKSTYVMAAGETIIGYVGTDTFIATGNELDNTITAGNGGSRLSGGGGRDALIGGTGADLLDGGSGVDTMIGNAGNDIYVVDNAGDVVVEKENGGIDEVRTTLAAYRLGDNIEKLTFTGTGAFNGIGNAADNVLVGGDGGAILSGGAGNDRLNGGAGNDLLDGGTGDDVMTGGAGNDVYIVDSIGDQVIEVAGGGTDEVRTALASYTLPDQVENLNYTGLGSFTATGNANANIIIGGTNNDVLLGGGGDDTLNGGAGDDLLDGGSGNDTLTGGAGNDIYMVDSADDRVIELPGGGTDEIRTTLASYTLGGNIENLTYVGSSNFIGTGGDDANILTGNVGNDTLNGGGGNDTLFGGVGTDTLNGGKGDDLLDGGAGDDLMTGGVGNDVYIVDSAGDRTVELDGEGTDEIRTSLAAYTLSNNVENLTYTGNGTFTGTGNALANVLTAGAGGSRLFGSDGNDTLNGGLGADYLDGGAGVDRMTGGAGNDIYVVDDYRDAVIEAANGGMDEIRTALGSFILTDNIENLSYTGTGLFQAMGNALDNVITGGSGRNRLLGGAGRDTLIGGDSADVLDGEAGADRMIGGGGNDIYFVNDAGDQVIESAGGGLDTVYNSITYTLATNVENLLLYGSGTIDGTGNELDNMIVGNDANNRLWGGAGNDMLYGGGGADTLDGGDGDDTLLGGDGNDTLVGGAGDDALVGGAGDDVIWGGAGADSLTGGSGADRFSFRIGDLSTNTSKTDTITDFSHDDGDKIDLSAFDADPSTVKRDAFTFVGAAEFSKRAGELRIDSSSAYQVILGDLDGDGVADFSLKLSKGASPLISTDFIL